MFRLGACVKDDEDPKGYQSGLWWQHSFKFHIFEGQHGMFLLGSLDGLIWKWILLVMGALKGGFMSIQWELCSCS